MRVMTGDESPSYAAAIQGGYGAGIRPPPGGRRADALDARCRPPFALVCLIVPG
jgi:hypothetical protein